jgi:hypothetical protein
VDLLEILGVRDEELREMGVGVLWVFMLEMDVVGDISR